MANLTVTTIVRGGIAPSYAAAAGGGDAFANTGHEFLHIKNGGGSPINLTIDTPGTLGGNAITNRTITIGAGAEVMSGPFPPGVYNDSTGKVKLTYSGVTTVTIAIFKLP